MSSADGHPQGWPLLFLLTALVSRSKKKCDNPRVFFLHMGVAKAPLCSDCLLTLAFIKAVAVAEEE